MIEVMIFRCDMYLTPNCDKEIDKYLKDGVVQVSLRMNRTDYPYIHRDRAYPKRYCWIMV